MIKLMIFDNDMTIVDSSHAIMGNFNLVADAVGKPHVTHAQVMRAIALPLPELSMALLGEYRPEWRELYLEKAAIVEPKMLRPFPGTAEALARLRELGVILAVASNREDPTPALRWVGLAQYFDAMIGGNGLPGKDGVSKRLPYKPDPAMLNALAEHFNIPAEQSVYVGDADIDIETARAANVRGIGVTQGNVTAERFLELGAWRSIGSLGELPAIVIQEGS